MTQTQCAMRNIFFDTNAMSALACCSKCIYADHRLTTPMTHVDKSSPSDRHLRYFCHTCSAIHRALPLRSLDDCPVPDELFQNNILHPQDVRLTQHLTREYFYYSGIRQLPYDKSPGDDELTYEICQEAPAEMKRALYKVVNQVIQNVQMPTSWEGALMTLIPKKVGEEKILRSICLICLMNTATKPVTSVWAKRLSKSLQQQSGFEGSQEGCKPDRSTRRQISRCISALQDLKRNQGTIFVTFLDFENYHNTFSLPDLFLLFRSLRVLIWTLAHAGDPRRWRKVCQDPATSQPQTRLPSFIYIRGGCGVCDAPMARFQRTRPVTRWCRD